MNRGIYRYFLLSGILGFGLLVSHGQTHAACQLPANGLVGGVKLDKDAPGVIPQYTVGENLTATVTGSDCEGTAVSFRLCPVGQDCNTNGKAFPAVTISNGSAKLSTTASQWLNFKKFRIHAEASSVNWKSDSSPFDVADAGSCVINTSSAAKNSGTWTFNVTTNAGCQGKEATFNLTVESGTTGSVEKGVVAKCAVANNTCSATWAESGISSTQTAAFKTCIQGNCKNTSFVSTSGGGTNPGGTGTGGTGTNVPGTQDRTYSFNITNPLSGAPEDPFQLINIITRWLLNISIPIAVLFILYAGFLMLTAGPTPAKFQKGKSILVNVVIGLAVIFIGRGFITLIYSVIELGGDGVPTEQSGSDTSQPSGPFTNNDGGIGRICQQTSNCQSGLKCDNTMCVRETGNRINEPCLDGSHCFNGMHCGNTTTSTGESEILDGRSIGRCALSSQ